MKFEYINCNICGCSDAKEVGVRKAPGRSEEYDTHIVRCTSCGLFYPNPMPRLTELEIQAAFSDTAEYFSPETIENRLKKCSDAIAAIERLKPERGRLLDIGCGRGEFIYAAAQRGWDVTGTEVSVSFAQAARKDFGVNVLVGDIDILKLPEESYDAVVLNSVIQYVPDPLAMLKKIYRLLKKGGLLYIEVTNDSALVFWAGDRFESMKTGKKITTHLSPLSPSYQIYGFNMQSLSKALRTAGFRIKNMQVKGIIGGGNVKGDGFSNSLLNLARKIIIFIGGLTGNGHLLYCIAKK